MKELLKDEVSFVILSSTEFNLARNRYLHVFYLHSAPIMLDDVAASLILPDGRLVQTLSYFRELFLNRRSRLL